MGSMLKRYNNLFVTEFLEYQRSLPTIGLCRNKYFKGKKNNVLITKINCVSIDNCDSDDTLF